LTEFVGPTELRLFCQRGLQDKVPQVGSVSSGKSQGTSSAISVIVAQTLLSSIVLCIGVWGIRSVILHSKQGALRVLIGIEVCLFSVAILLATVQLIDTFLTARREAL